MPDNHNDVQSDALSRNCVEGKEAKEPVLLKRRFQAMKLTDRQIADLVDNVPPGSHEPNLNIQSDPPQGERDK